MWTDRFKELHSFDELTALVEEDKQANGMGAVTLNRYPLRFVLFDNFEDSFRFIEYLQQEKDVAVKSVDQWIDKAYPDLMITYQELSEHISDFVRTLHGDCVITPFSELARFYDNIHVRTFDSLITTLKAIEASRQAGEAAQRVYIPIVGLEGKMQTFEHDPQINVWHLHQEEGKGSTYRMVLVDEADCYGVKNYAAQNLVVGNVSEWLDVWKDTDKHDKRNIICTSHAIHANAGYAQPDNAFTYVTPGNVYEFLTDGLRLNLGQLEYDKSDDGYWLQLAEQIDLSEEFSLDHFVCSYFEVSDISTYRLFLKAWFAHGSGFDRWLLCSYYANRHGEDEFLAKCIESAAGYSDRDFFTEVALYMSPIQPQIEERRECLRMAATHHVTLTEETEIRMGSRLENIAKQQGHREAIKYFTRITEREKALAIAWIGQGKVSGKDVRPFYPELFDYVQPQKQWNAEAWMASYIDCYKKAKLGNVYTDDVKACIEKRNADNVAFDTWYQTLKTTRTLLAGRTDIDLYYWIDGLGVEWIPYVEAILKAHQHENVYLNDVMVARASLPTTTSRNKEDLQKLTHEPLQKVGDLDALAHQPGNTYPVTFVKELNIVREAIERIIHTYAGKKIAIVSDHGLTYLSQLQDGLNLGGFESDHHGRLATASGHVTTDDNYLILDDGQTACALRHRSLCGKVPRDQGIHGGCTPEEVLVPIFIVSGSPSETQWSVVLLTPVVQASNPKVRLRIRGLKSNDVPQLQYDGRYYSLDKVDGENYESAPLTPKEGDCTVSIVVGSVIRPLTIEWQMGATEDDLFNF